MLNKTDIDHFRQRLTDLKQRLRGDFSSLQKEALRTTGAGASGNLSNMPVHPADLGTDNFEQELTLDLIDNKQQIALDVGDAMARLDGGAFGKCENCGREIARNRLEAVPWARYCIRCAEKMEEGEQPA